ncbi:MAG: hypothetical protein ACTSRI_13110, partial [Promethearchaeota archaeon]
MSSERLLKIGDVGPLLGVTTQTLRKRNRKLSNFKTSALDLLERKCLKRGVAIKKVHPAYTSLIGKCKYSRLYNLSTHVLASYVIARKGLGFKDELPANYKWLLSQVGDAIKPRLKPSSPYRDWAKLHDFFKHSGITSFKTSEVMSKILLMKHVLNSVTSEQPDNLRAGLSTTGKVDNWNKLLNKEKMLPSSSSFRNPACKFSCTGLAPQEPAPHYRVP